MLVTWLRGFLLTLGHSYRVCGPLRMWKRSYLWGLYAVEVLDDARATEVFNLFVPVVEGVTK